MGAATSSGRAVVAAALLASVAALGGCTRDPASTPSSPSTAPPISSTAAPTSTAPDLPVPELPAEAQAQTDLGAMAFVKHWYALVNYSMQTGDTLPVERLSDPDCETCADYVQVTKDKTADGLFLDGPSFVIETVNAPKPEYESVVVRVTLHQDKVNEVSPDGTKVQLPGEPTLFTMNLLYWVDDAWVMGEIGQS